MDKLGACMYQLFVDEQGRLKVATLEVKVGDPNPEFVADRLQEMEETDSLSDLTDRATRLLLSRARPPGVQKGDKRIGT